MDLRSDPPLRLYQFPHSRIINSASRVYYKSYYAFLAIPSDLHMSHPRILTTNGSPHTHSTHRHHIHSASPCPLLSHAICIRVPTFAPACPVLLPTSLHKNNTPASDPRRKSHRNIIATPRFLEHSLRTKSSLSLHTIIVPIPPTLPTSNAASSLPHRPNQPQLKIELHPTLPYPALPLPSTHPIQIHHQMLLRIADEPALAITNRGCASQ